MAGHKPPQPQGSLGTIYNQGTLRVVVLACLVIILSVILTGAINYYVARDAVLGKLKTKDMLNIVDAIGSKIDGRIERAKETSLSLAHDPAVIAWVSSGETDDIRGDIAKARLEGVFCSYDYANTFIVSAVTNHYWAEGARLLQVMSPTDPSANWFFTDLTLRQSVIVDIDYNKNRQDTFIFVNALIGDVEQPLGIAGVGLSLKSLAQDFQRFKYSENSNLWLIDQNGKIQLADNLSHNGFYLNDIISADLVAAITADRGTAAKHPVTLEYTDAGGQVFDLAYQNTRTTDWKLVVRIPRNESLSILDNIKGNTTASCLIVLLSLIFVFYLVSRRIANPLQQALRLNREMERQVLDRTQELSRQNEKIMDSISYAKRLQEAILPTEEEMSGLAAEHFVIWQPRDVVGGDFYWSRRLGEEQHLLALCDCTGHGVPGAFMTMAVNTLLNHIVARGVSHPAEVLTALHREFKATLHRNPAPGITDDGLDIGLCLIDGPNRLFYAGAKLSLYMLRGGTVSVIKGDRRSIGYRRSGDDLQFTVHEIQIQKGDRFYLATDGYTDQNGEVSEYPFGKKRLIAGIKSCEKLPLNEQALWFNTYLEEYRGTEMQRDDITLLGFSLK
ncbi:MAG TPA: SpoIIE family protein phosphatase [Patescibacteria group bacterium]|nr:SpoIIE family protein phosphatase [Patescibacteria group bacterium]